MHNEISFPDRIRKATIEDLRFMLKEVQEKNKSLNERADSLYEKSVVLFGIAITAITSIIVYLADRKPSLMDFKFVAGCEIVIILIAVCVNLKKNLVMAEYHGLGTVPKVFTNESLYPSLKSKKSIEWTFTKQMILDHHERIEQNRALNKDRAHRVRRSVEILYLIPLVTIPTGIVIHFVCF